MKKKLKLNQLKVESFITQIVDKTSPKGASGATCDTTTVVTTRENPLTVGTNCNTFICMYPTTHTQITNCDPCFATMPTRCYTQAITNCITPIIP